MNRSNIFINYSRLIFFSLLLPVIHFTDTLFAEDLILDNEFVYLSGTHYYDNVIIINGGTLVMGEFDGSQDEQGTLLLYCDSLYIDATSQINGNGMGGQYGDGMGEDGSVGAGACSRSGGGGGGHGGV